MGGGPCRASQALCCTCPSCMAFRLESWSRETSCVICASPFLSLTCLSCKRRTQYLPPRAAVHEVRSDLSKAGHGVQYGRLLRPPLFSEGRLLPLICVHPTVNALFLGGETEIPWGSFSCWWQGQGQHQVTVSQCGLHPAQTPG